MESYLSVPRKSIKSPTLNGACRVASGAHVMPCPGVHAFVGGGGIMKLVQYWPVGDMVKAGNGTVSEAKSGARGRLAFGPALAIRSSPLS